MRTRQRGLASYGFVRYQHTNPNGSVDPVQNVDLSPSVSQSNREICVDTVTKDFRRLVSEGHVFMGPMTLTREDILTDVQSWTVGPHLTWGVRSHTGTPLARWVELINSTPPAWYTQRIADAKARTLLMAHSRVASEEFLALVTVKEAGKTATMLAKPFGEALKLIDKVFTRKLFYIQRDGRDALKAFASAWSEYRFGWKPILYEIEGIWSAYVQSTTAQLKTVRKVARASDSSIVWKDKKAYTGGATFASQISLSGDLERSAKVASGVLYELTDDSLADATARRMGLRLSDVPSTLWEITPYSFVVDRFIDIGVWLQAITPKPGVKVLGTWTTTTESTTNKYTVLDAYTTVVSGTTANYPHHKGAMLSAKVKSATREANPAIPTLPTVNYRDLNLVQQIDHAALILQRLLNLKKRT